MVAGAVGMGVCAAAAAAAVERARSSRSRGAVLARPHTSSPCAAEGLVRVVVKMGVGVLVRRCERVQQQWQQQQCEEEWLVDSLSGASFAFRVN